MLLIVNIMSFQYFDMKEDLFIISWGGARGGITGTDIGTQ